MGIQVTRVRSQGPSVTPANSRYVYCPFTPSLLADKMLEKSLRRICRHRRYSHRSLFTLSVTQERLARAGKTQLLDIPQETRRVLQKQRLQDHRPLGKGRKDEP